MRLADLVRRVLGPDVPVAVHAYDGSESRPPDAIATFDPPSPEALQRFVTAPGELGLGRAYVAGDIDVEGDLFGALARHRRPPAEARRPRWWPTLAQDARARAG